MNISALFIDRPVGTTLLTIGLVLAGAVAFRLLPVSPLPRVDFPTIAVGAGLPGADPETMATSVAAPLERQFGLISGVTEMTSSSSRGSTSITLQFDLNRDIDGAARDVQAAINAARSYLPANLPNNPTYRKVNPAEAPILIMSLTSDTVTKANMYDAASSILQQKLSQVEGVGQVFVGGGALPAVRVDLNPMALNKYGISLETVRGVLASTNANRPKGQLSDGTRTWEIETNDQLRGAEQYRPLVLSYRSGAAVRLPDVGAVQDSVEDLRTSGVVNGKSAVMIVVFRQPAANIISTVDRVRSLLPQLEGALPGGIKLSVVLDRTPPIRASLRDVEISLVISAILVILVVFSFLRNARSTLIPGVAVATSLIGTFGIMYLFGYSLNNLSLMALTIATGFVVDDAIVVLENITRYMEKGMPAREAAFLGAQEISFTVVSMSLSLVAVFIPILLMGGIVGRLFREFAVTLSAAVLVSLVVSLTATPMMCALLLKREKPGKRHGKLFRASEGVFNWMHDRYAVSLRWSIDHPQLMLILVISAVFVSLLLFIKVPKGFFPEQDTGRLGGTILADQDISFQAMAQKMEQVVDIIRSDPDVESVAAFTGGGAGTNTARMFIALKPFEQRKASAGQVIARLRPKIATVPGAPTFLQLVQELRVGGRMGAGLYQYTLQGQNVTELNTWATRLLQQMRGMRELVDVSTDQQDKALQVFVQIDRSTASRFGITPTLIDSTLYDAFGQRQVSVTYTLLNQYHVIMEVEPKYWQHPETLRDIYVPSTTGDMVPLSAFSRFERIPTALTVNHQSQFPAVTLSFNLPAGVALGDAVQAVEAATRDMGLPASIRGSFQGTAQAFQASLANEPLLILAAILAIYIVLGVLYESYIHPITILSTLPSAGVGALLALLLFRIDLSIIALIGIILLIGIVKKNGIMMVDFALDAEREEGKRPEDAIYQASLLRFRPIMMTTMAALLGALPLAVGLGVGSELRRPLGIAIVGGLIFSQALTLYTTPVIYLYLDRFSLWARGKKEARHRSSGSGGSRLGLSLFLPFALCIGLEACSVGPNYVRPSVQIPAAYKETEGWKRAEPQEHIPRGTWWEVFCDVDLNALEAQVNISNQNLAQAEAIYRQARAAVQVARAGYFPTIAVGASVTRSSRSTTLGTTATSRATVNDYVLPVDFSWELDIWGRVRRLVEANRAIAEATAADVESVRLSAQALLAQDYFQLRSLDAQRQLLEETVAAYRKSLQLTTNQYNAGIVARADVLQAETQLKNTEAQALDVQVQRAQLEHAIALLIGKPASEFSIAPSPVHLVPPLIPAGVPSELLERRPDIAAAERRVASANAQIGVAEAAFFPTISLGGSTGFESTSLSKWLTWPSRFWSLGPSISEIVFEGFQRRALTEEARAVYDANVANYRQIVLTSFQEVEDNLAALRILEAEAQAQAEAVRAAEQLVAVSINQYKAGLVSYLNVVVAQAAALNTKRTALNILYARMNASVLLVRALGGGWGSP
jgi:multidrug efflux pump